MDDIDYSYLMNQVFQQCMTEDLDELMVLEDLIESDLNFEEIETIMELRHKK